MFFHLFYFQFRPLAGLETQVHAPCIYAALALITGKTCGYLQRSPPEEVFPELGMESRVGDSVPVLFPPAVYGCRAGQPRSLSQLSRRIGGRVIDLRFWSRASSHLVQWSRTLCLFFFRLNYSNNPLNLQSLISYPNQICIMKPQMPVQRLGKGKLHYNNHDHEMKSSSAGRIPHQCFEHSVQSKKCN